MTTTSKYKYVSQTLAELMIECDADSSHSCGVSPDFMVTCLDSHCGHCSMKEGSMDLAQVAYFYKNYAIGSWAVWRAYFRKILEKAGEPVEGTFDSDLQMSQGYRTAQLESFTQA